MVIWDCDTYLRHLHGTSRYGIRPRGELFPFGIATVGQLRFLGGTMHLCLGKVVS